MLFSVDHHAFFLCTWYVLNAVWYFDLGRGCLKYRKWLAGQTRLLFCLQNHIGYMRIFPCMHWRKARTWPDEYASCNIYKYCLKYLTIFKLEPLTPDMPQHSAKGKPNARNMLGPTTLWHVCVEMLQSFSRRNNLRKKNTSQAWKVLSKATDKAVDGSNYVQQPFWKEKSLIWDQLLDSKHKNS